MIRGFFGDNRWLSNFWFSPFIYNGKEYATVEHYYQSRKSTNVDEAEYIRLVATPQEAKRLGGSVKDLHPNFMKRRRMIMRIGVEEKFLQNADLKAKLLATDDDYLEETNTWGDKFWGVCNGDGHNHLGFLLMDIRSYLRFDKFWISSHKVNNGD